MSLLWKLGGVALACVAAYFLVTMYGKSRFNEGKLDEREVWLEKTVEASDARLAGYQQGIAEQKAAETIYHETVRTLPPVTNTIIERSTRYAETSAGAVQCLPADRVLWLEQSRAQLFPTATAAASGPVAALSADAESVEP